MRGPPLFPAPELRWCQSIPSFRFYLLRPMVPPRSDDQGILKLLKYSFPPPSPLYLFPLAFSGQLFLQPRCCPRWWVLLKGSTTLSPLLSVWRCRSVKTMFYSFPDNLIVFFPLLWKGQAATFFDCSGSDLDFAFCKPWSKSLHV